MREAEEIMPRLEEALLNRHRVVVLLRHDGKATGAAELFRQHMQKDHANLLRPATFTDHVKLSTGAWAFFISCSELSPDEDIGQSDYTLWPSEEGVYAMIKTRDWRIMRKKQDSPWRPSDPPEKPTGEEGTVWDKLLTGDEIL